jgi:protein TonB
MNPFGRTDRRPRALGAGLALVLHGAAWALVWQALAPRPAAPVAEAPGGLVYLHLPAAPATPPPAAGLNPPPARPARAADPGSPLPPERDQGLPATAPRPGNTPSTVPAAAAVMAAASVAPATTAPANHAGVAVAAPAPAAASAPPEPARAARALAGNRPPAYPEAAREDGLQGRVQLQLQIDAQGTVTAVQWLQRSGIALLDLAARDAVRAWRFEPARRGGQDVPSSHTVTIRFELNAPPSTTLMAGS